MNKKVIISVSVIVLLLSGYFILDTILFDGVKPEQINENGFQAKFYATPDTRNKATVILLGGGQWGEYWGAEVAKNGFVGLSIPYSNMEGLPLYSEEIPLEYFENAIVWLKARPEVNPEKILVMGASRNAELALVLAAHFPQVVSGAVAYAPSSVSWSNTVLPYNSDEIKSSWTYKGEAISYIPMEKISGSQSSEIKTLAYWEKGLEKSASAENATIKVENVNGPILLFSGKDDQVWPSSRMADSIEARLQKHNFKYAFQNIQYENAGHLISGNPGSKSEQRTGTMTIEGKNYNYQYGGTNEGDYEAKKDAKARVLEFLKALEE